jgi:ribosomal protein S18 acetylase RimI-like enzyme
MIVFRKAGLEDTPLIEELAQEIFPATYKEMLSEGQVEFMMDWMYSQENLRRQILEDGHIYHFVYYEGEPVGYVSLQQQGERLWHLQKIYLKPGMQGKSVGKKMFLFALEYIRANSLLPCTMELNVNRDNVKAWKFYEHMGMHKASSGDFHIGNGYYMTDFIMAMEVY